MRIGFVGLGRMGSAMAARLLAAGGDLKVWNRSLGRTEPLQKRGADVARDLRDFADREVVFTMLSDDAALRAVVLGDPGLLAILQEGAIHLSCSTITVALSEELGQRHRERG
jgi:3-hydroxyisobutyrate dehydrogenase-like beta-hydroxyacid dehydrogenase